MNKIVLTEKYFDEYTPTMDYRKLQVGRSRDFRKNFQRTQLLKVVSRDELEVSAMQEEGEGLGKTKFIQSINGEYQQNLVKLESKFSKSLNQALHEFLPKKFGQKNSNLSNYDFGKSIDRFPSIRPNLTFLMKNSYSEAVIKKNKLNSLLMKHSENRSSQSTLVKKLQFALKRKASAHRHLIEQKLPQFRQVTEDFIAGLKGNAHNQNIDNINANNVQRGKSVNLLRKYNDFWNKSKDMSLRKTIVVHGGLHNHLKEISSRAKLDSSRD
jgi:hypothetical protein